MNMKKAPPQMHLMAFLQFIHLWVNRLIFPELDDINFDSHFEVQLSSVEVQSKGES